MAKRHHDSEEPESADKARILQEAQRFPAEIQIRRHGERREMRSFHEDRIEAPRQQHDYHHCGDLHHLQCLIAGFFDTLDVLPPEVNGDNPCDYGGGSVHG